MQMCESYERADALHAKRLLPVAKEVNGDSLPMHGNHLTGTPRSVTRLCLGFVAAEQFRFGQKPQLEVPV